MHRKRVLVTGASGMLGRTLVPVLLKCGYTVIRHAFTGQGDLQSDLADWDQARQALNRVHPEVIVNLAANTNVDECEANPKAAFRANVLVVENLTKWIKESKSQCRLIQISTDHVYDGVGPHQEERVAPTNYYAFSKYAGELVAMRSAATVLRTNFFGPSGSRGRLSFSDWVAESLRARRRIIVYEDVMFSPLTMVRLAEYIELTMRRPHTGVFNVGSRSGKSKAEFAFEMARVLKLQTATMARGPYTSASGTVRPRDMRMDCRRFEATYDVRLPTLEEEVRSLECVRNDAS